MPVFFHSKVTTTTTKKMPFTSQAQWKRCYVEQARHPNSGWDCHKWAKETKVPYSKLPAYKPATATHKPHKTAVKSSTTTTTKKRC